MPKDSYLVTKEKQLLQELKLLESVDHPVTKGEHLEAILQGFFRENLPKKYSTDSGFIIGLLKGKNTRKYGDDQNGKFRSKEMDIVIFDEQQNINPLKLLKKKDFYVESVYAVISIKKHLNKQTFIEGKANMLDNLVSSRNIKPYAFSYQVSNGDTTFDSAGGMVPHPIISAGFAFSGVGLKTIKRYLDSEISKYGRWYDKFPNIIAVLGKGIIVLNGGEQDISTAKYSIIDCPSNTLEEFFIYLLKYINNRVIYIAGVEHYRDFYN